MHVPDADRCGPLLKLSLGGEDRALRVLARDRSPLSGVGLNVGAPGGFKIRSGSTGSDGRFDLAKFPSERADVWFHKDGLGFGVLKGVELRRDDDTELVLDPAGRIVARVLDGDVPISGAQVEVRSANWPYVLEQLESGTDGSARSSGLLVEDYDVAVHAPWLWPVRRTIRAQEAAVVVPIQVRRLGHATLTVRRSGLAVAGAEVRIDSEEFGDSVAQWVADGRVAADPSTLQTDSDGHLRLQGLPRGRYAWSIAQPDGGVARGTFEVQPAQNSAVVFDLP
jgi:hypothetical protein